jgi:hypothetical protein
MGFVTRVVGGIFTALFAIGAVNFIGIYFSEARLLASCESTPAACPRWLSQSIMQGEYSALGGALLVGLLAGFACYRFVYPGLKETPEDFAHVDRWLDSVGFDEAVGDPAKVRFAVNVIERAMDRQYAESERIASRAGALLAVYDGAASALAVAYLAHALILGSLALENGFVWVAGANVAWGYAYLWAGDFEPVNPLPILETIGPDIDDARTAYLREMVLVSARNEAHTSKKVDGLLAGFIMAGIGAAILLLSLVAG